LTCRSRTTLLAALFLFVSSLFQLHHPVTIKVAPAPNAVAFAHDDSKYPDWSGQWRRPQGLGIQWDPSKKLGRDEQTPLTPAYQKVFEAGLADQVAGGQGNDPTYTCIPPGMP
jgi:hypothetical protein